VAKQPYPRPLSEYKDFYAFFMELWHLGDRSFKASSHASQVLEGLDTPATLAELEVLIRFQDAQDKKPGSTLDATQGS
jgi:hypothetical protein